LQAEFCTYLTHFRGGHIDRPAEGLSSASLVRFAKACARLEHVEIKGAVEADDAVLYTFLDRCPKLVFLQLSGSSYKSGRVSGWALRAMEVNPRLGRNLKTLDLRHQTTRVDGAARQLLNACQSQLEVLTGRFRRLSTRP